MALNEMAWKSSPDDQWILANWPPKEIRALYCDSDYWGENALRWESIRQYRKKHRHELGVWLKMEKPTPFENISKERERVRRIRENAPKVGEAALKMANLQVPLEHLPYHEKLQKALEEHGNLSKARFSNYQMGYKDSDGEAQVKDLEATRFEVAFDIEPLWPLVTRVESVRLPKKERVRKTDGKKAVILPDLQIPFHDEKALSVALKITRDVNPDLVVILGDLLDLAAYSKYLQEPEWAFSIQEAINCTHLLLQTLRKMCPSAEIVVLEGNHDARLPKDQKANSAKSLRLKRADQLDNWPVMSVPYLTAMDTLDIEYLAGYPANRFWINDNLQVRHGQRATSRGSTAKMVSDDERVSTIFGHVHRLESHMKTVHTRSGGKTNAAYSIGCLCKIDGSVPSTKSGFDLDGKPITNYEDWQQGLAVVDYEEGDSPFSVHPIFINTFNNYAARYGGKTYVAD